MNVDLARMAAYRFARLQAQLLAADCAGALLFNSASVRYATGTAYAQIANLRSPFRSVFVPAQGKATMYDWEMYSFAERPKFIGEYRDSITSAYRIVGEAQSRQTQRLAADVAGLVDRTGQLKRLATDSNEPELIHALSEVGIELVGAHRLVQRASAVKNADELACIEHSIEIAEIGIGAIRQELRDGISEQELWALLAYENARQGGEWFDYRILASGQRTNPWGQEVSDKLVRSGEMVGIDSGMIGPLGYGADISRSFVCPPAEPTAEQCRLYQAAYEQLQHNIELIRPGLGFRDFSEQSWYVPSEFWARRYNSVAHGVGMGNEWPLISFISDWTDGQADGEFEPGMVFAVEACIGRENGQECVKLEDMVVVEESGCRRMSSFPFEDKMLQIG